MSAPALIALALLLARGGGQGGDALPEWHVDRDKVELGEPVECRLVLSHAASETASLPDGLALDDSWLLIEDRGARTTLDANAATRATTTFVFELASLEPGARELAGPFVALAGAGPGVEEGRVVQARPLALTVRAALYPEEDAPRPIVGFPAPSFPEARSFPWLVVVITVLVLGALAWWAWRRRARGRTVVAVPLASASLAALAESPLDSRRAVQDAAYTAAQLLRSEYDRALGVAREGLTDEEWVAAVTPELPRLGLDGEVSAGLARFTEACGAVKYGFAEPTHWAARETLALAQSLAQRAESAAAALASAKGRAA